MRIASTIVLLFCALFIGCQKKVETATSGHRLLLVTDPYVPVLKQEVDEFMSIYPEVKMEVRNASTREAIVLLLNDSVRSIVVDRQFNDEERQVIRQAGLRIAETKIAEEGIAIIVHKQNPMVNIDSVSAHDIVSGKISNWKELKGAYRSGQIDFIITGKNSGVFELLQKKIFSLSKSPEPSNIIEDQSGVIKYVAEHPFSIGFVAASLVNKEAGNVKVLRVISKSPEGDMQEYLPGQQEIFNALYPFHYSLYLYNAEAKTAIGGGFGAFVLSNVGQKYIQNAGLVPAVIPYHTIQLHAE